MPNIVGLTRRASKQDIKCLLMARLGLSAKTIAEHCRMSPGMVHYRCRVVGIKLREYRDGRGPFARAVIEQADRTSARYLDELKGEVRKILADQRKI